MWISIASGLARGSSVPRNTPNKDKEHLQYLQYLPPCSTCHVRILFHRATGASEYDRAAAGRYLLPVLHGMLATGAFKLASKYVAHAINIAHIYLSPNNPHVQVRSVVGCDQGISSVGMVEKEKQRDMMKPGDGDVRLRIYWMGGIQLIISNLPPCSVRCR